jgi:nitrite reductase (NADH) large subunit
MARIGLETLKAQIADNKHEREALYARFLASQEYAQVDPWAKRAEGFDAAEFRALRPALREAAQ